MIDDDSLITNNRPKLIKLPEQCRVHTSFIMTNYRNNKSLRQTKNPEKFVHYTKQYIKQRYTSTTLVR